MLKVTASTKCSGMNISETGLKKGQSVTNKVRMDVPGSRMNGGRRRKEISLTNHLQTDSDSLGNPMGMVYHSYLEEANKEEQVKLESSFTVDESRNETTALMTVTI